MKTKSAVLTFNMLVIGIGVASTHARADEFAALPGLWKSTSRLVTSKSTVSPQEQWHCVDEAADPWIDYAQLPDADAKSCTRTSYERTATSLKWQVECSQPWPVKTEGTIVFDSPEHYRGTVHVTGVVMNYPVDDHVQIEGQRHAACTSPSD